MYLDLSYTFYGSLSFRVSGVKLFWILYMVFSHLFHLSSSCFHTDFSLPFCWPLQSVYSISHSFVGAPGAYGGIILWLMCCLVILYGLPGHVSLWMWHLLFLMGWTSSPIFQTIHVVCYLGFCCVLPPSGLSYFMKIVASSALYIHV